MASRSAVDKIYKSLNEEQQDIIAQKTLDGRHTAVKWLRTFRKLALLDKLGDSYRADQSYMWKIVGAITVGMISFFAAMGSENYFIFIVTAACIGAIIKVLYDRKKIKKLDLSNHLRLFLMPLLTILREDVSKNKRLSIQATLKEADSEEYKIKEIPFEGKGYPKINELHYKIPRIILSTTLIDNTALLLTTTDFVRKRNITKKNPRGKIKYKTKFKVKQVVIVKLQFKKSIYQLKEDISIPENIIFAENDEAFIFKAKVAEVARDVEHCMKPNKVLKAVGSIYKLVKPIGKEVEGVE